LSAAHASYYALYAPSSDEARRCLPGIDNHLKNALDELHARSSAEAVSPVAIELEDAQLAVPRFRKGLLTEERTDGR